MNSADFVQWLKQNNLFDSVEQNYQHFKKIFQTCLGAPGRVNKRELLIVTDLGTAGRRIAPTMAGCYLLAAKRMDIQAKVVVQDTFLKAGMKVGNNVVTALDNLLEDNIIALAVSGKFGNLGKLGKSYRKFSASRHHTFLSTMGLGTLTNSKLSLLINSINVDYPSLRRRAAHLKRILDHGREVHIITDAGTDLKIDISTMTAIANDGNYAKKGGNMPTGEVYIAPKGKGVNGNLVIDATVKTKDGTFIARNPVKVRIEKGSVVSIEGDVEAEALKETIEWAESISQNPQSVRRIAELGIGINPGAEITDSTIISEKMLGTAHIAFGSNAWFGGSIYSRIHIDQVFKDPKIWVDGKRIAFAEESVRNV